MKNMIKLVAVVAFLLTAMGVSAQVKLGHIETQKLIQAMPEMASARKTMETKQAEIEKELTNMQEQFKVKLDEYSKNGKTMSDVIRASKEQELQELQQRIQSFQQIAMDNLEKTQAELMQPIMDKALNAIKAVGKENGFTYIFDMSQGGILFNADNTEDVLPLVKKKLGLQ
ncbi:MAG: OmpH family outer membrane protein [Odoribacter sp.]|nr:OmpH family outer membrane protein [Odoribacter sp.]MDY3032611.1 OmpH family outer membrane protein [Odoribacter sp.]